MNDLKVFKRTKSLLMAKSRIGVLNLSVILNVSLAMLAMGAAQAHINTDINTDINTHVNTDINTETGTPSLALYRSSSDLAIVNTDDLSVVIPCLKAGEQYYHVALTYAHQNHFYIADTAPQTSCNTPRAEYDFDTAILEIPQLQYQGQWYLASLQLEAGLLSLLTFKKIEDDTNTSSNNHPVDSSPTNLRVPAEWETHAATWMQWPNQYDAAMRTAFSEIIAVVQQYEPVHLLTSTQREKQEAIQFLTGQGVSQANITWHIIPTNNAWMRDNGPIYVTDGEKTWVQNWKFDAWGGNFGADVTYQYDNQVPPKVAAYLGVENVNHLDYVLEKGNLEFNGNGILVLNWDCQDDRNPGLTQAQHEAILKQAFGVTKIIWAYGHIPGEGTTGHIDGTARFINENTLAIADYDGDTEKNLAIAAKQAGLNVVWYPGDINWLVGNGFVVAAGEQDVQWDNQLKSYLQEMFPTRDIHLINAASIAEAGGGIHCVTNDQPSIID